MAVEVTPELPSGGTDRRFLTNCSKNAVFPLATSLGLHDCICLPTREGSSRGNYAASLREQGDYS